MRHLKLEDDFLKVRGKRAVIPKKKKMGRENSEIKYHRFQEHPELPGLLPLGSSERMPEDTTGAGEGAGLVKTVRFWIFVCFVFRFFFFFFSVCLNTNEQEFKRPNISN